VAGDRSRASILFCQAFGKAQRILAELAAFGVEDEVLLHRAVEAITRCYRGAADVTMIPTRPVSTLPRSESLAGHLVLAPPFFGSSAHCSAWMKRLRSPQTAFASRWVAVRGTRRQTEVGNWAFALGDQADWNGLLTTFRDCAAGRVFLTHGQTDVMARYLNEIAGLSAEPLATLFDGVAEN